MNGYWHITSRKWSKRYSFDTKCFFSLPDTLKVTGSTISTPRSYDEHPWQVKYGSPPPPPGLLPEDDIAILILCKESRHLSIWVLSEGVGAVVKISASQSWGPWFDPRPGRGSNIWVISFPANVHSAFHPSRVGKMSWPTYIGLFV